MGELQLLSVLLQQWDLKSLRLKQILIFLIGYSISELNQLCPNIKISSHSNIKIFEMIDHLSIEINKRIQMNKKYLIQLFLVALTVLKQKYKQQTGLLCFDYKLIYQQFMDLITAGFQVQQFKRQNLYFHLRQQLFQKENLHSNKGQHANNDQNNKILQKTQTFSKNEQFIDSPQNQLLCQICCFPLNSKFTSISQTTKITSCHHIYHSTCLFQNIKEYMNTHSEILLLTQKQIHQKQSALDKKNYQEQILTQIKCPNFQNCLVYLSLMEVHNILLTSIDKQYQQPKTKGLYLDKLYQLTLNDYLISYGIRPFDRLKYEQEYKQKSNRQVSSKDKILFYCQTNECNAVYQMDKPTSKQNLLLSSPLPDLFVCFSCKYPYCLKCFSSLHPTMTCKQHIISSSYLPQDQQLQKFMKTLKKPYKRCPKCRFYVDNWRGCSTVKCRCGTQFCYKCGNIGCPHAKCLKQIQKENGEKVKAQTQ